MTKIFVASVLLFAFSGAQAQSSANPDPSQMPAQQTGSQSNAPANNQQVPTFRVNVVGRNTQAVNWHHASGTTKVDLKGTDLMPSSHGIARVTSEVGRTRVETQINTLGNPQQFGREYMTYVLWAITPEGRAENLGEVIHDDKGNTKQQTFTTELQAFGLIVTAEPYYGVTTPSDLVCLEDVIRRDTVGATEPINVHYSLIGRGAYIPPNSSYNPPVVDNKLPYDLFEAENAVAIAKANGADHYAPDAFKHAQDLLTQAQGYAERKHVEAKPVSTVSREVVQQAEDARAIAVRREIEEQQAQQQADQQQREQEAKDAAEAARQKAESESAARVQAEQQAQQAAQQQQQAEQQRQAAEQQREAAEQQAQQASSERQQADAERQQAEAARQQALLAQQQAQQQAQQAQQEKEQLRQRLLQQFNTILATRDTARGLIAQLSDVLFATGSYQLRPPAKLALAKFSGIVQAYPGLHLQIEGNTDSTGSDALNQRLSEKRADSVRDFLVSQGVQSASVTAVGLGKDNPIASNNTALGRKQNRRVDIVVSGDVIGQPIGVPPSQQNAPPPQAGEPQQAPPAQPRGQAPQDTLPSSTGQTNPGTPR